MSEKEPSEQATEEEIARARGEWQNDDLEIDDDARVSRVGLPDDVGHWVAAWVWMDREEVDKHCPTCVCEELCRDCVGQDARRAEEAIAKEAKAYKCPPTCTDTHE